MPIYFVRWPGTTVSLVKAKDMTDLQDILDEIGDPAGCRIREYRGPLLVSFDLEVDWEEAEDGRPIMKDVSNCISGPALTFLDESTEFDEEMYDEIVRLGFPSYHEYLKSRWEQGIEPNEKDEDACRTALQQDFHEPLEPDLKRRINQNLKWGEAMGIIRDDEDNPQDADDDLDDELPV